MVVGPEELRDLGPERTRMVAVVNTEVTDEELRRMHGLGVRGLWMGLSTGLILCGVVLTWHWHRRSAHYEATGRTH